MLHTLALLLCLITTEATMPTAPASDANARLAKLVGDCDGDPVRFIEVVMGDKGLWSRQKEICRSAVRYRTTAVAAGNGVGKSYCVARLALALLYMHRDCVVVITAPTNNQLKDVLWKELARAHRTSKLPLGGSFGGSPLKLTIREEWFILAHSGSTVEAMSGQHARHLFFVVDEASGVEEAKYEAGFSLNPSRVVMIGNPLRPAGRFFETCNRFGVDPDVNLIRIPSTESPHAHLERSTVGMADAGFLRAALAEYGESSIWHKAHIQALFPTESAENVVKAAWLDLMGRTIHVPKGENRLAIDLAGGNGGDQTVLMVRDDNGIRALEHSNLWDLETAATIALKLAREWKVAPSRVSFDAGGLGQDFAGRLAAVGLGEARPYLGGKKVKNGGKLRWASARLMRFRLDVDRQARTPAGLFVPQAPFAIRPEWLALFRPELMALRYVLDDGDGSVFCLEPREKMIATLKHSPDFADTLIQSFAFPD